jgi:hypothetical protein
MFIAKKKRERVQPAYQLLEQRRPYAIHHQSPYNPTNRALDNVFAY